MPAIASAFLFSFLYGYFFSAVLRLTWFGLPWVLLGRIVGAVGWFTIAYLLVADLGAPGKEDDESTGVEPSEQTQTTWNTHPLRSYMLETIPLIPIVTLICALLYHWPLLPLVVLEAGIVLLAGPILLWSVLAAAKLSGRRLQVIGLLLTLIGIATQFVPPVLDLLNVKVA